MHVDRHAFVQVAVAMAACGGPHIDAPVVPAVVAEPVHVEPGAVADMASMEPDARPSELLQEDTTELADSACDNRPADLSSCRSISPSCEGMQEECAGLSSPEPNGFAPRVAERIARCWADNLRGRGNGCRTGIMATCIRTAIDSACVDPEAERACDNLLEACFKKGIKPTFTRARCIKMLSSVVGRTRMDAIHALGPTREGCSDQFALPYYPYNRSTW